MPRTCQELEQRVRQSLAPYAQMSGENWGRTHPEIAPDWRTECPRDPVIHSRAFYRLEYKNGFIAPLAITSPT